MSLPPAIAIHLTAALGALVLGPVALWARQGRSQRPKLHRAAGYAWVTLMVIAAVSALFIHDPRFPTVLGYFGPIHIFVPLTFLGLWGAFHALAKGDIANHRKRMQGLYYGACVGPAVFALLPGRFLGRLVWGTLAQVPVWGWAILGTWALAYAVYRWGSLRSPQPTN